MDTRIGYPNEHLAGNSDVEISSPLYATAVGLMMNSIENKTQSAIKIETEVIPNVVPQAVIPPVIVEEPIAKVVEETTIVEKPIEQKPIPTERIKFLDFSRYLVKIKEFLDNAE
jgi:cell division protein FtsA